MDDKKSLVLKYYSRDDVLERMFSYAAGREVVCATADGTYFKRPDAVLYPRDILERVKRGAVSFHCSVEHWTQPLAISQENLEALRSGFDVIIDIDSKFKLEHGRECAIEICEFLKERGITPTIKFSGRRGFHIAIAQNALPEVIDNKPLSKWYPDLLRLISTFISESIKERLMDRIVAAEGGYSSLSKYNIKDISPYEFVEIEKNWGQRHLFRMPYSFNEKSWLISIPIKLSELKSFEPSRATPDAKSDAPFLVNKDGEAIELVEEALGWAHRVGFFAPKKIQEPELKRKLDVKIPEEYFPPCIKNILNGLSDGKKRSLFTLVTFLSNVGWTFDEIQEKVREWNSKNNPKLSERYITTQLKWYARQVKPLMPYNCGSDEYYTSIGICQKNENCGKNPVNYAVSLYMKKFKEIKKDKIKKRRVKNG